jgi:hypothetical protein
MIKVLTNLLEPCHGSGLVSSLFDLCSGRGLVSN